MSAPDYQVLGSFARYGQTQEARLAVSLDGTKIAVVLAEPGAETATPLSGPWDTDTVRRCAENVLTGHPRALTWSPALMCLAAYAAATFLFADRNARAEETSEEKEP